MLMAKPILQVIAGGSHLSDAEIDAAIAAIGFEALMDRAAAEQFAARAEKDAAVAAGLVTAAVAILAKSKGATHLDVVASDHGEAAEGHHALKGALAAADTLATAFRAAEARFLIAITAAACGEAAAP
jgi:hypothetical protein